VPAAEAAMGQVDILIANAGITRDNLFVQLRDEDWDDVINVNLTATFRLARAHQIDDAQALRPHHRDQPRSSASPAIPPANYTASKAGLIGLIKTLGAEYAKRNVTANCIAPGFIKTPMTTRSTTSSARPSCRRFLRHGWERLRTSRQRRLSELKRRLT